MVDIAPTFTRTFHCIFNQLFGRVQQVFRSAFKFVTGNSNANMLSIYSQHNRSLCNGSKALFGNFGFLSDFGNQCIISPDVPLYSLLFDLLKNILRNSVVKVKAAKVSIAVSRKDIKFSVIDIHDCDIKCASA